MFDFGKSGKFSGHGVKCHKNVYFVTSRDRYKFYDIKETVSFYELSRNYVFLRCVILNVSIMRYLDPGVKIIGNS